MWHFAYDSVDSSVYTSSTESNSVNVLFLAVLSIVVVVAVVFLVAGTWKMFEKAGEKGWHALVPIYSSIVNFRIVGMSGWWTLVLLIPFVNYAMNAVLSYKTAKAFGYGIGMTILNFIGIGYILIGFGKSQYLGPDGNDQPKGSIKDSASPSTGPVPDVGPKTPTPPTSTAPLVQ